MLWVLSNHLLQGAQFKATLRQAQWHWLGGDRGWTVCINVAAPARSEVYRQTPKVCGALSGAPCRKMTSSQKNTATSSSRQSPEICFCVLGHILHAGCDVQLARYREYYWQRTQHAYLVMRAIYRNGVQLHCLGVHHLAQWHSQHSLL